MKFTVEMIWARSVMIIKLSVDSIQFSEDLQKNMRVAFLLW